MRKWLLLIGLSRADIENPGLVEPSKCEACKYFTVELKVNASFDVESKVKQKERLTKTGKIKEVITTGHGLGGKKQKKFAYNTSEIRLIESMEDICDIMLEYNMHKEREGNFYSQFIINKSTIQVVCVSPRANRKPCKRWRV